MRWRSSAAALVVKVTPRISSGRAKPLTTSHTTRSTMVAVFPDPAPATTRRGARSALMMRDCSAVGAGRPRMRAISSGVWRAWAARGVLMVG